MAVVPEPNVAQVQRERADAAARAVADVIVIGFLLIVGYLTAVDWLGYFRAAGNEPQFYQLVFEPAVRFACGQGLTVDIAARPEQLTDFLNLRLGSLRCSDLPAPSSLSDSYI